MKEVIMGVADSRYESMAETLDGCVRIPQNHTVIQQRRSILVMAQRLGMFPVVSFDVHIRQMAGLGIICLP